MNLDAAERSGLDPETYLLVRLAALVAMDAAPVSYLITLGAAADTGLTVEQMQAVLVAIAPVVGSARVTAAAGAIVRGSSARKRWPRRRAAAADLVNRPYVPRHRSEPETMHNWDRRRWRRRGEDGGCHRPATGAHPVHRQLRRVEHERGDLIDVARTARPPGHSRTSCWPRTRTASAAAAPRPRGLPIRPPRPVPAPVVDRSTCTDRHSPATAASRSARGTLGSGEPRSSGWGLISGRVDAAAVVALTKLPEQERDAALRTALDAAISASSGVAVPGGSLRPGYRSCPREPAG